ncbi:hypothetical protein C1H46_023086 [Malus baccata]|uniref:Uncharacterized protein n=1 Tax=Malus baccata TaxID=106549 RepID=A0A540LXV0_MALBA|nr:hypothetical protein C1H46_023086 [Malus baccata]
MQRRMSYFKFAHFTANQATLEATEIATKIHIFDFGIVQGSKGRRCCSPWRPAPLENSSVFGSTAYVLLLLQILWQPCYLPLEI